MKRRELLKAGLFAPAIVLFGGLGKEPKKKEGIAHTQDELNKHRFTWKGREYKIIIKEIPKMIHLPHIRLT